MRMVQQSTYLNLLIAFFFLCNTLKSCEAGLICPLCGSVYNIPTRWDFPVDTSVIPWKTCKDIYFETGTMNDDNPACSIVQAKYQSVCCDAELPDGWEVPPTPAPKPNPNEPQGNDPECLICGTQEYPGKPNTFIVARYVGEYTCGALYSRGKDNLIPGFMCAPLQDYAYEICGCGEFNPACKEDKSRCYGGNDDGNGPNPSPIVPKQPVAAPTRAPTGSSFNRKSPPSTSDAKKNMKLSRAINRIRGGGGGRGLSESLVNDSPVEGA